MQPTANQLKEVQDCWNSFFKSIGQKAPVTGTGIYQAWLSDWINHGKQYGPPMTHEYNSNDWSGNSIVVQDSHTQGANGSMEYRTGILLMGNLTEL